MRTCFRIALGTAGTKWVPHFVLSGYGLLFQVTGAPRCPVAYAYAVAALAAHRNDVWGPTHALGLGRGRLQSALDWADAHVGVQQARRHNSKVLTLAKAAELLHAHPERLDHGPLGGRLLYACTWGHMYKRDIPPLSYPAL